MRFSTLAQLPGEPAVAAALVCGPAGAYYACGTCLALVGSAPRFETSANTLGDAYTALALSPDLTTLAVGRGDGRVELRDPRSLQLFTYTDQFKDDAILALHYASPEVLAVASDDRTLRFLDLSTFTSTTAARHTEPFDHGVRGNGKVIAFRAGSRPGQFVAIGVSRQVSVFEGTREVRSGFFDAELGDARLNSAAVLPTRDGDVLFLACRERGLWAIPIESIPRV